MFYRHHSDKLIFPIVALIIFLVLSYRPKSHLTSKMPEAFFPGSSSTQVRPGAGDKRVAWAYWEIALMDIQWKFTRNSTLPADPPPEFRVDVKALEPATSDPELRQLYWRRLQLVWNSPDSWKDDYQWDFGWVRDPVEGIADWARAISRRFSIPGR
jgi:hypothetical protein